MALEFKNFYEVLQTCNGDDTFYEIGLLWNPKIYKFAQSGKMSVNDIKFCFESIRCSYECGYITSMIWSKTPFNFSNMNEVMSYINQNKNNKSLPLCLCHDISCQIPEKEIYEYEYEGEDSDTYDCNVAHVMSGEEVERFYRDLDVTNFYRYLHGHDDEDSDENLEEMTVEYAIKDTRFQYMKFGQYYIFMVICDH